MQGAAPSIRDAEGATRIDSSAPSLGDGEVPPLATFDSGASLDSAVLADRTARADAAVDSAAPLPRSFGLCDGSQDLRLAIWSEPGELSSAAWYFSHPYGISFLVLNGRCEYVISFAGLRTWRQGTLTKERAEVLAASLHLFTLPDWATKNQDRWNGGRWSIRAGTAKYTCGDCAADGPAEAVEAVLTIPELMTELEEAATPLTGSLEIVIFKDFERTGTEAMWPLPWSPSESAVAKEATFATELASATRTLTGDEAIAMRKLRDSRYQPRDHGAGQIVQHEGRAYFVTMRDVLPLPFQNALMNGL